MAQLKTYKKNLAIVEETGPIMFAEKVRGSSPMASVQKMENNKVLLILTKRRRT
jgi:hypothetical protein